VAEPVHEQISAALRTRLLAIVEDGGATYWYTPDAVVRCLEWLSSYDVSKEHMLFIKPEPDTVSEATTGTFQGSAPFSVLIVRKDERASRHPFDEERSEEPIAATVISRAVADVRAALLSEVTLGGLAWNVADGAIEADYSFQIGGAWLAALLTFTVKYDYPKAA
jgi:hypothetical protein